MIKQMAWNIFKNTGNIDTFLELKNIKEIEENMEDMKVGEDEVSQNEWSNNSSNFSRTYGAGNGRNFTILFI